MVVGLLVVGLLVVDGSANVAAVIAAVAAVLV